MNGWLHPAVTTRLLYSGEEGKGRELSTVLPTAESTFKIPIKASRVAPSNELPTTFATRYGTASDHQAYLSQAKSGDILLTVLFTGNRSRVHPHPRAIFSYLTRGRCIRAVQGQADGRTNGERSADGYGCVGRVRTEVRGKQRRCARACRVVSTLR